MTAISGCIGTCATQGLGLLELLNNDQSRTSSLILAASSCFSLRMKKRAARSITVPCPQSPNITAKRKGNVIIVYGAENNNNKVRKHRFYSHFFLFPEKFPTKKGRANSGGALILMERTV